VVNDNFCSIKLLPPIYTSNDKNIYLPRHDSLAVAEEYALNHVLEQRGRPKHPSTEASIWMINVHASELPHGLFLRLGQPQHSGNLSLQRQRKKRIKNE